MTTEHTVLDSPRRLTSEGDFSWREGDEALLKGTPLVREWLLLANASRPGSIYLHPAIVLGMAEKNSLPLLCAQSTQSPGDSRSLNALAILAARTQRLRLVSPVPVGMMLQGHRVIGNQVLGATDQEIAEAVVRE